MGNCLGSNRNQEELLLNGENEHGNHGGNASTDVQNRSQRERTNNDSFNGDMIREDNFEGPGNNYVSLQY